MSIAQTALGGGALIALSTAFLHAVAPVPDFLEVNSLNYSDGIVTADRTVAAPSTVADWRVTIVGTDDLAPTCNTIPGMGKHEGWSPYQAGRSVTEMDIDTWVGQAGCYDTLTPGEYTMFVNWTPRDGREPAYTSLTFMK